MLTRTTAAIAIASALTPLATAQTLTRVDLIDNGDPFGLEAVGIQVIGGSLYQNALGGDFAHQVNPVAFALDPATEFDSFVAMDGGSRPVFGNSANVMTSLQGVSPFMNGGSHFNKNSWFGFPPGIPLLDTLGNGRPEMFIGRITVTDGATLTGDIGLGNVNIDDVNLGYFVVAPGERVAAGDAFIEFILRDVDNSAGGAALDGFTTYDMFIQQNPTPGPVGVAGIAMVAAARRRR